MTLTTDAYWDVNGTPLHTLAFNIETIGSTIRPAPMRGTDIIIPYAPGETFTPKVPGSRTITLAMWVRGADADGNVPANKRAQFEANWQQLIKLLYNPRKLLTITKRIWVAGSLRPVVAQGQFVGGMDPAMFARDGAKFTVDIKLLYPWFIDTTYTTFNLVNGHQNIDVPGVQDANYLFITYNGARVNPEIVNWTTGDTLKIQRTLLTSTRVEVDVMKWQANFFPSAGGPQDAGSWVRSTGAVPMWMIAEAGINDVELKSDSGTGSVQLQVKGSWP